MAIFAEIHRPPDFDFNRPVPQVVEHAEYSGKEQPSHEAFHQFQFDQTVVPIEGGQSQLRLRQPLVLKIDPKTLRFSVQDWGIEMDCLQLGDLPRELARKFARLLSAAEHEKLSEQEQAEFIKISDYIDFQEFSIARALPRYMEGRLETRANQVAVKWHDGSREVLSRDAARGLSDLDPGERFSAYVKLGKDDKALSITRVSPLVPPDDTEDWDSWPQKA